MKRVNLWFRGMFKGFWMGILANYKAFFKTLFRLVFVLLVVLSAWNAFLYLIGNPPIDTTPALVMVWISVAVVLLAAFPKILESIRKIKIKDFEIELQHALDKASVDGVIPTLDLFEDLIFTRKGDWHNLIDIVEIVEQAPARPLLLVANLRSGEYISIPMLFGYLHFLGRATDSIIVLFIDSRAHPRKLSDIRADSVIGVISGRFVYKVFSRKFPELLRINQYLESTEYRHPKLLVKALQRWYGDIRDYFSEYNRAEYLSEMDVRRWFSIRMSSTIITANVNYADRKNIQHSLAREEDFLIVADGESLSAIVSLCKLTMEISKKVLVELEKRETS